MNSRRCPENQLRKSFLVSGVFAAVDSGVIFLKRLRVGKDGRDPISPCVCVFDPEALSEGGERRASFAILC
jgi:hypothetical protein